jgi:hypothetical protein
MVPAFALKVMTINIGWGLMVLAFAFKLMVPDFALKVMRINHQYWVGIDGPGGMYGVGR